MISAPDSARNIFKLPKDDLTVVVPVLNEERGVGAALDDIIQNGYQNIMVVDGYSTDSTVEVARGKNAFVISQHGKGKTGAVRTAIENVSTLYMVVMDGDYTYDAADIEKFLDHARLYDEIIGARDSHNISSLHRFGNRIISSLFNALMGTKISDVCSGMYLLNSKFAKQLNLQSTGFSVEVELLAQTALHGRATEIPVNYRKRIGKPKLSTWAAGFGISKAVLGLARRYNPVFLFSIGAGCAIIPGVALLVYVVWDWVQFGIFRSAFALFGVMLLLLSSQSFMVGTLAILIRRSEIRVEALVRQEMERVRRHLPSE